MNIEEKVKEIINDQIGVEEKQVIPNASFVEDFEADVEFLNIFF